MRIKGEWLWTAVALVVAGCASSGTLDIRPIGQQGASAGQPVPVRIALANGHLALGNVALALEEYRRAAREQPDSIAALAGMAECYERMGRLDLSRRYYEQALAITPDDVAVSLALASSLDQQGRPDQARSLRREVAERAADTIAPAVTAAGSVTELPAVRAAVAPSAQKTIVLPAPRPVEAPRTALRLERLSTGEVALVTSNRSPWVARKVAASPRSVTIQFEKREAMVVLNAARVAGIAARTRDYLARRGFAGASIGDAPSTRQHTLIRYPAAARARAERIAAQFPFPARLESTKGPLTLLVGRDAAARRTPRAG